MPKEDHTRDLLPVDASTDSEDGLDIVQKTRKGLDLSQYIDGQSMQFLFPNVPSRKIFHRLEQDLTQTQPKSQNVEIEDDINDATDDEVHEVSKKRFNHSRRHEKDGRRHSDEERTTDDEEEEEEGSDILDEDNDVYEQWKNRKTVKRKRVAAETNRIRAQKKSRANAATRIVGRKVRPKKANGAEEGAVVIPDSIEDTDPNDTFLDEPTPEYIERRKNKLKRLHEAGLRLPPNYDGIDFSDSDSEEKPILDSAIKPQRPKQDIVMTDSEGGTIPASIAQWLRDYQVEGVSFLHERFVKQTGAILGDDMGLGKTIQVIAFLTAAFGKTGTKRDAKYMRKIRRYDEHLWYPKILIICPGGLMSNWEDELEKWGWWEVSRYHGNPTDRRAVLDAAKRGRLEIMITTYHTYLLNEGEINIVDWDCIIADECHTVKNKNSEISKAMNKINALCRIGLTGTAIQNKYEELWNLLNWARPGAYGSAQEWKQNVAIPLKMGQAHDASNRQLADARSKAQDLVHGILPGIFLRRMKTLIADQLPKKSDRVIFCQLTDIQADAYRAFIDDERCDYLRRAREPCDCNSGGKRGWCCYVELSEGQPWYKFAFPCMVTLQKLSNHLALLIPSSNDPIEKQNKDLETLRIACPDEYKELDKLRDKVLNQSQREFCGKWKVLKRLLDFWHSNGDKALVFSHSVRLLRLLKTLFDLDGTKYNFSYLDGSMTYADRAAAVADFNANPSQFVFLISTKAGGVGLNITSANKVVVVDPHWNPAYDLQAQDRAYRIGQTRDVEVFRLVSSGTIEEIVYARQIYKQQQANIAYNASHERRYFKGVMDQKGKKGEIFGLENLFTFQESNILLRDIMHKTNVAETRAGVNALACNFEDPQPFDDSDDDEDVLSDKTLGIDIPDGEASMTAQMKKIAMSLSSQPSTTPKDNPVKPKPANTKAPDPVNAILAKAGVQYTHENSEVIGRSEIEAKLSKQALELRNDTELSKKPVFFSQSQSQSQSQSRRRLEFSPNASEEEDGEDRDEDEDVTLLGEAKHGAKEFRVNYKYRPNEEVRRRQFCEMSRRCGYEDPVEFALVVEGMTQDGRRKMLEKFYRRRRKEMGSIMNVK